MNLGQLEKGLRSQIIRALRHPLINDTVFLIGSRYAAFVLKFLKTVIAARILGPADYGMVTLAVVFPTLLQSFASVKSLPINIRYLSVYRSTSQKDEVKGIVKLGYGIDFLIAAIVLIVVLVTGRWVARSWYHVPQIAGPMVIYTASLLFSSLIGTSRAVLCAWQRFRWLATTNILFSGITLIFVVGFLLAGFGVYGVILALALENTVTGIIMMLFVTYVLYKDDYGNWFQGSLSSIAPLKNELMTFFGWNYLAVTLSGVITQAPLILLGRYRNPEEVGLFQIATNILTAASYPEASMREVAYPELSTQWATGERKQLKSRLRRWVFKGGLPISLLILSSLPLLPFVIPWVLGSAYAPSMRAAQVMLVGEAVAALFFWRNPFYYASGNINTWAKSYAVYTAVMVAAAWFVVPDGGFLGLAFVMALGKACFILAMGLPVLYGKLLSLSE